jgi:Domain of unknown function (DUF4136)
MKPNLLCKITIGLTSLAVLALFTGCESKPEIKYEADRSIDVSGYKTYVLVPFSKTTGIAGEGANPGSSLKYAAPITASVKGALAAKGYSETTDKNEADFAVNVRATVVPKTDITDWGYSYGAYPGWGYGGGYWGGSMGYNTTVDQYNQGVLRIEIYDAKKKSLAWVGWATHRLDEAPTDAGINTVVGQILANFPPPPPPPPKS